jgi:hypothetical protein
MCALSNPPSDIPDSDYADKNKGWRMHYGQPLKKFFEK